MSKNLNFEKRLIKPLKIKLKRTFKNMNFKKPLKFEFQKFAENLNFKKPLKIKTSCLLMKCCFKIAH